MDKNSQLAARENEVAEYRHDDCPWSEESESALIGCLLAESPDNQKTVLHTIRAEMFYGVRHRQIVQSIMALVLAGQECTVITLTHYMRQKLVLDRVGGPAALSEMLMQYTIFSQWPQWWSIVEDCAKRRKIMVASRSIAERAKTEEDPTALALTAASELTSIARDDRTEVLTNAQIINLITQKMDACSSGEIPPGIPTGFAQLDDRTGGLDEGTLWLFSAPTSEGKSTIMQQILGHVGQRQYPTAFYSCEMSHEQCMRREISRVASLPNDRIKAGNLTPNEVKAFMEARKYILARKDWRIIHCPGRTVEWICADIKMRGLRVAAVDYLQKMDTDKKFGPGGREQQVSYCASMLKQCADSTGATILTASQLNDEGKLRESKASGHEADLVFRQDVKKLASGEEKVPGMTKQILRNFKNRDGEKDWSIPIVLKGAIFTFEEDFL